MTLICVHASLTNLAYTCRREVMEIEIGVKHRFFNHIKLFLVHVPHNSQTFSFVRYHTDVYSR